MTAPTNDPTVLADRLVEAWKDWNASSYDPAKLRTVRQEIQSLTDTDRDALIAFAHAKAAEFRQGPQHSRGLGAVWEWIEREVRGDSLEAADVDSE